MERESGSFRFLAARLTLAHMHVEVSRDVLLWLRGGWNLSPESWSAVGVYILFSVFFFLFHTRLAGRSAEDFLWKNNLWIFFISFFFLGSFFIYTQFHCSFSSCWTIKGSSRASRLSFGASNRRLLLLPFLDYMREIIKKKLKSHEWISLTMERQNESVDVDFELDPRLCADKRLVFSLLSQ